MLLGCLLSLLLASPGLAGWGKILAPGSGDVVSAGEEVEVSWSPLPGGVDEFEILLSMDDGAHFTLRLTPQLDPGLGVLRWTVPNLPSSHARLRLRVGFHGHEIDGPIGTAFQILPRPDLALATPRFRDGEWWMTHNPTGMASGPGPSRGTAVRAALLPISSPTVATNPDQSAAEVLAPHPGVIRPRHTEVSLAFPKQISRQPRSFPLLT